MATIDKIMEREDFKILKSSFKKTFGDEPKENIYMENKKYIHLFEIEIKNDYFNKTEVKLSFEYTNKKEPFLVIDCEVLIDGVRKEQIERYFFAKYKQQFSEMFLSVEDHLIEWLLNKEGKLYLFNKISDKIVKFRIKELQEKDFELLERNFLEYARETHINKSFKIKEIPKKESIEITDLFERLEEFNFDNAVNIALKNKDYKYLKKIHNHLK
jgi:hypothetical protein